METAFAWTFLLVFWVLPLAHVAVSSKSGPWRPPSGSRCPFGPRAGWLVMVLVLGLIGWAMFWRARFRSQAKPRRASAGN